MADRATKERKLVALMVNDLGPGFGKGEMAGLREDVRALADEDLDGTLAERLGLPHPADEESLDQALLHVEEPEVLSGENAGGFTGAPDMSHEPRPEERQG
ncbi:MAG: hypothetical protein M3151_06830 [Actinomycetota bacterium]|nr:hypothetical protein [Actinomycetota bacterium]